MPEYLTFWENLSVHYPLSKGEVRLPIAAKLQSLPNFNHSSLIRNLKKLLQEIINEHGNIEAAHSRAKAAGEGRICPLLTDEITGIVRFDCVIDENTNQTKIVELNCDYPDGLLLHDKTYSVLSGEECDIHEKLHLELFPKGDVYILHHKEAGFLDAYQTEANLLSKQRKTEIGSDLEIAKNFAIIRRNIEVSKLSSDNIAKLNSRYNHFINTFSLRTLGYKDLFSEINHPLIPKTTKISKKNIVSLLKEQDNLVIKPLNGCEGRGVHFGKDIGAKEWKSLIENVSDNDYIAQELINMKKMSVSFYDDGSIREKELYFDMCPHFFVKNGKVIGNGHTLMRFSENKIVNISKGGGIGYHKL